MMRARGLTIAIMLVLLGGFSFYFQGDIIKIPEALSVDKAKAGNAVNKTRGSRSRLPPAKAKLVEGKPFLTDRTRPDFSELFTCKSATQKDCQLKKKVTASYRIIDYAVVGFAKCGTTTMGQALGQIAQAPRGDTCAWAKSAIRQSYKNWTGMSQYGPQIPSRGNNNILAGLKCPAGLELPGFLEGYAKLQPQTLLIVGIRHPVLAFQSWYNMFVQNGWRYRNPYIVVPSCRDKDSCGERGCPHDQVLCTDRLRYSVFLAKMGKTPMGVNETALLPLRQWETPIKPLHVRNKVFLYEITQLDDDEYKDRLLEDLARMLEYPHNIPPDAVDAVKPGMTGLSQKVQAERDSRKIKICDDSYKDLRVILMDYATRNADWICQHFLHDENNGVFVSSREDFCPKIMSKWKVDPCDSKG